MADLYAPLRSLRDSLHALLARAGDDAARATRVTRALLKVNVLLEGPATGSDDDAAALRDITEKVAVCDPRKTAVFDVLMGWLETLLATL